MPWGKHTMNDTLLERLRGIAEEMGTGEAEEGKVIVLHDGTLHLDGLGDTRLSLSLTQNDPLVRYVWNTGKNSRELHIELTQETILYNVPCKITPGFLRVHSDHRTTLHWHGMQWVRFEGELPVPADEIRGGIYAGPHREEDGTIERSEHIIWLQLNSGSKWILV